MLENLLRQYGYVVVYAGGLVEPDATLVAAVFLAHRGYLRIPLVFLITTLATISMSQFWFWLARRRGRALLDRMSDRSGRYERVRRWIERNGEALIFFSRFLWGLRIAIASSCGASGMRPLRFAIVDSIGAVVWTAIIGTAGYGIAHALGTLIADIRRHEDVIALTLLGGITLFALWWQRQAKDEVQSIRHPEELGVRAVSHVERSVASAHGLSEQGKT